MKRSIIALAVVVAVQALAACGGGGYSSDSPPAAQSGDDTATVSVQELGDSGRVLVNSAGKALYAADEEVDSSVICTGACTSFWIPLTIEGGAPSGNSLPSELGVVDRPDGTRQVTFGGKRLYTFVEDEPGDATGDGFSDAFDGQQFTWHVVSVGDAPTRIRRATTPAARMATRRLVVAAGEPVGDLTFTRVAAALAPAMGHPPGGPIATANHLAMNKRSAPIMILRPAHGRVLRERQTVEATP
jgi:predicted lipoprotein with Yx(FWY)xxD motif